VGGCFLGFALAVYQCQGVLPAICVRPRIGNLRRIAAEYRSFALISAPSGIINALGAQAPSAVLPYLYGPAVSGQYSLAMRVLSQPMVFIGQATNQVLWGSTARVFAEDPARLWPLFLRVNALLFAVMAPAFVLTYFGAEIFSLMFGAAWRQAGDFAGVMMIASFLGLAAFGTTALEIYRLNHWMSAWEIVRLLLVAGALAGASLMALSPMLCVAAVTAALAIANATLLGFNALAVWQAKLRAERPGRPEPAQV
jgi:O-antigen/teichoic acid export membrane protein